MEEREEGSLGKAETLTRAFRPRFFRMSHTIHPTNLLGEAPGKSSNESWAAKQAVKDYAQMSLMKDVIMTVMDGAL